MTRRTRRTWTAIGQTTAVVAVSVIVMSLPAADGAPWPDDDGPWTVTTDTTSVVIVWPVHPADGCMEDESWTAVDYRSPDGVDDVHGVTRACRHNDDTGQWTTDDGHGG